MSRRQRKRQRVYAHVLNELKIGQEKNAHDLIDSFNSRYRDTICGSSFAQIMRGLAKEGFVTRQTEWISGRTHEGARTSRGQWVSTYLRLK